jgi:hypothetical protein
MWPAERFLELLSLRYMGDKIYDRHDSLLPVMRSTVGDVINNLDGRRFEVMDEIMILTKYSTSSKIHYLEDYNERCLGSIVIEPSDLIKEFKWCYLQAKGELTRFTKSEQ